MTEKGNLLEKQADLLQSGKIYRTKAIISTTLFLNLIVCD